MAWSESKGKGSLRCRRKRGVLGYPLEVMASAISKTMLRALNFWSVV